MFAFPINNGDFSSEPAAKPVNKPVFVLKIKVAILDQNIPNNFDPKKVSTGCSQSRQRIR